MISARMLTFALAAVLLTGCNVVSSMKEGWGQAKAVAQAVGKRTGTAPQVGFKYVNGKLASVTLQFREIPQAGVSELAGIARSAVREAFGAEPEQLIVSFVFEGR